MIPYFDRIVDLIIHYGKIKMKREKKKETLIQAIISFNASAIGRLETEIPDFKKRIQNIMDALDDLTSYHPVIYRRRNRLIRLKMERALRRICGRNSDAGIFNGYSKRDITPLSRMIRIINLH